MMMSWMLSPFFSRGYRNSYILIIRRRMEAPSPSRQLFYGLLSPLAKISPILYIIYNILFRPESRVDSQYTIIYRKLYGQYIQQHASRRSIVLHPGDSISYPLLPPSPTIIHFLYDSTSSTNLVACQYYQYQNYQNYY